VLEPVEDLLQCELDARKHGAVRPRHPVGRERATGKGKHGKAGRDEEWNLGDDKPEDEE
jgi:hypothetical protein